MGKHKVVRSEEHKQRIAAALKASWTPERRAEMAAKRTGSSNPFFGKSHTDEFKNGHAERFKGSRNPFFGRQHSEEFSKHQSEARKGKCARLVKYGVSEEEYARRTANGERWCYFHRGFSPADQFNGPMRQKSISAVCTACTPDYNTRQNLRHHYGKDVAWYEEKLKEQGGACAICGVHDVAKNKRFMCVDHDHETGEVRGILCAKCNTSVERVETITDWNLKTAAYLAQYKRKGS